MNTTPPVWQCTWHTGPDTGRTHSLAPGHHLVGRAHTADVRCDDPALEPHHALLDVSDDAVSVTQLTGRVPVRVDGRPIDGSTDVSAGQCIEVGGSLLLVQREVPAPAPATVLGEVVVRGPRAVPTWTAAELTPPESTAPSSETLGGLVPALLGLAGAGTIALVLRQPMFLMFGMLGAVVAVGSWAVQRVSSRRRRRREQESATLATAAFTVALAADRDAFTHYHLASTPTTATAQRDTTAHAAALWTRRSEHEDAYSVSLGVGDVLWRTAPSTRSHPVLEPLMVQGLPVPAALSAGTRLAVTGPQARGVARALLAQLVASCGPADLRVVVVTDHPDAWECVRRLPHVQLPDGTTSVVDEDRLPETLEQLTVDGRALLVLVTDSDTALATRTSPLRRAVGAEHTALLAVLPPDAGVPHLCTATLETGHGPMARWVADTAATLLPVPVRVAAMGDAAMARCSAALTGLQDPEDPLAAAGRLPRSVVLDDVLTASGFDPTPEGIAAAWSASADPAPRTTIGTAADGIVDIDLVRDGPHALIAGTTGSGKSELLLSLIVGLAAHAGPAHLAFVLVDYKGGATFDACAALPHVVGVVTDLDEQLADRALRSLHAELRRREAVLREHHAADLTALRLVAPHVVLPRLVVVIDEFAALVAEQPDFLHALVGVAQRGRSLGVHLLLATQRPHGVISDDIRANTNLRIALRLHDATDAIDVVGDHAPAQLPRGVPGRAVMRLGPDENVTFQTARCDTRLVDSIVEAVRISGATTPPAPWLPPLPDLVCRSDLPAGAVGICDDPDHQRRAPLRWSPDDGSVIVAGSAGSGVSSALHTLAAHVLATHDSHVYVVLARADDRLAALAGHPRCVVVAAHERERTMRLFHRLRDRLRHGTDERPVVLVVDGLEVVRRHLDQLDTAAEFEALDEVLAHGDTAGITLVCGVEQTSALPTCVVSRCAHRWVMHLHDPLDAAVLGVTARQVPGDVHGRVFVGELGLNAQLMEPGAAPLYRVGAADAAAAPAIDATPAVVVGDMLPTAWHSDASSHLPVGLGLADGEPVVLEIPDGDHVLVVGGRRTGRSTSLARLAHAWREAHPGGAVTAVLPRRSAFPPALADAVVRRVDDLSLAPDAETLLVVDDAELVDDCDQVLATLASSGRSGLTILAAGRPDALRQSYGHWTAVVRRSRTGLVGAPGGDTDADLLGATVPRRLPVAGRPGLAWLVEGGSARLVQVAVPGHDRPSGDTRIEHVAK